MGSDGAFVSVAGYAQVRRGCQGVLHGDGLPQPHGGPAGLLPAAPALCGVGAGAGQGAAVLPAQPCIQCTGIQQARRQSRPAEIQAASCGVVNPGMSGAAVYHQQGRIDLLLTGVFVSCVRKHSCFVCGKPEVRCTCALSLYM